MKKLFGLVVLVGAFAIANTVEAGILGKRYIGANIGQVTPGDEDVKRIDDSIITYGAGLRLPINTNLDVVASIGHSKLEGNMRRYDIHSGDVIYNENTEVTGTFLSALVQYQFVPGAKVNPFVNAGVEWAKSELESAATSIDDDDTGFLIGGGIEFNIDTKLSVNTGINYLSEMFDEDDFIAGIGFNAWVTPQLLLSIVGQYGFNSEDIGLSAGFAIGF
jgi:opacity protein-like surface antigen